MKIRGITLFALSMLLLSNCGGSSKFITGSNYDPTFDPQRMDNMAIILHEVDDSDEEFWNVSNERKTPESIEKDLFYDLNKSFEDFHISVLDAKPITGSKEWEELKAEVNGVKQYLIDLNKMGTRTFSYQSSFNYRSLIDSQNSAYAFISMTEPYMVGVYDYYSGYSSTPEFSIFSYIIDLATNKVVWVFNNKGSLEKPFNYAIPQKTALASLLLGKELTYSSFDFDTNTDLKFVEKSGNLYIGSVSAFNGLYLTIETKEETFDRHLREFTVIETVELHAYDNENPRIVYPEILK